MNVFIKEFIVGIKGFLLAVRFIDKHKLYVWLLLPLGLNILLFFSSAAIGWALADQLTEILKSFFISDNNTLNTIIGWSLALSIRMVAMFLYILFYKNIVFIVLSPLLAILSEKTDEKATGKNYPFSARQLLIDVLRGLKLAIRNLILELGITLVLLLFAFIPLIGLISPILLILVQSYFYGFSMVDYNCERYKMSTRESLQFAKKHRSAMVGLGLGFYSLFLIPYVGWIIGPVLGIVGGTLVFLKIKKPEQINAQA